MLRLLSVSSALALAATPALAQQADPMASPTPPTEAAPPAEPAPPADAASQPAAGDRSAQASQLVETEFPVYDTDKNGELSQAEFSKWVLALHSKAESAGGTAAKDDAAKQKWANDAFKQADADKSKRISKAEMSQFLQG